MVAYDRWGQADDRREAAQGDNCGMFRPTCLPTGDKHPKPGCTCLVCKTKAGPTMKSLSSVLPGPRGVCMTNMIVEFHPGLEGRINKAMQAFMHEIVGDVPMFDISPSGVNMIGPDGKWADTGIPVDEFATAIKKDGGYTSMQVDLSSCKNTLALFEKYNVPFRRKPFQCESRKTERGEDSEIVDVPIPMGLEKILDGMPMEMVSRVLSSISQLIDDLILWELLPWWKRMLVRRPGLLATIEKAASEMLAAKKKKEYIHAKT